MKKWLLSSVVSFGLGASLFGAPLPNFKLVDQQGKTFATDSLKGNFTIVSFVFTRCPMPKMCPLTVQLNKQLLTEWKKALPQQPLKLVLATLDPDNDVPGVLAKFAKGHSLDLTHFVLLTGKEKILEDFASQFNVIGIPGEGLISHNARTALLAPDLTDIKIYKENEWTPAEVIRDAKAYLSARKN